MARQVDRRDSVSLGHDRRHPQPVAPGPPQGQPDAEHQHAARRDRPERPPVHRGGSGVQELLAGPQLVRQGKPDAEIGIQVKQVPGLVAQPFTGCSQARDDDHSEASGTRDCEQHAGVVPRQVPQRRRPGQQLAAGVTPRVQHDVRDQEVDRCQADQPVHPHDPVLPEGPFKRGDAGDEQDLDQQQV